MTREVSNVIPGSLERTNKNIEVADGHTVMAKQKWQVGIKMCDDNGDNFIATLHNVLLTPDLCDRLFSIITLMNSGHTCLFQKKMYGVIFYGDRNAFTLPHSAQQKHDFWREMKQMSKTKKLAPRGGFL